MIAPRTIALAALVALAASTASAQVPPVYVPDSGVPSGGLRLPQRIEPPAASRPAKSAASRRASVPSPTNPAIRIEVPDTIRRGETSQDRIARCQHYGTLYGVPDSQRSSYINRCAF